MFVCCGPAGKASAVAPIGPAMLETRRARAHVVVERGMFIIIFNH